jgi:hypothetical protein
VAAVVCTAAIATGGAVEVNHQISRSPATPDAAEQTPVKKPAAAPAPREGAPVLAEPVGRPQAQTPAPARAASARAPAAEPKRKRAVADEPRAIKQTAPPVAGDEKEKPKAVPTPADPQLETGGARAPDPAPTTTPAPTETPAATAPTPAPTPAAAPTAEQATTPESAAGGTAAPPPGAATPGPAG